MIRSAPVLALALLAACAAPAPRLLLPPSSSLPPGVAARLAGVRCLLVAPLENASDEPLGAEAATGALAAAVNGERTQIFPIGELRALFARTALELPEGIPEGVAQDLGEVLGADAVLYGGVAGRTRGSGAEVTLTVRVAATGGTRETLFWRAVRVVPGPREPFVVASRRAVLEAAGPMLAALGSPGPRACFDKARVDQVRALARETGAPAQPARSGSPAGSPARTTTTSTEPAAPARRPSLTERQEAWVAKLGARERFVVEDVAFAGRAPLLEREEGLADLALALAAAPAARVRLEGFTDAGASEREDLKVSMEFARAAGRRLVELGVPRDRVTWAGRGREAPVAPGFTAKGRLANRRVEAVPVDDGS